MMNYTIINYLINVSLKYNVLKTITINKEYIKLKISEDVIEIYPTHILLNNEYNLDVENTIELYIFKLNYKYYNINYLEFDIEYIIDNFQEPYSNNNDNYLPGCYRIIYSDNTQYVGKSLNLHKRLNEHKNQSSDIINIFVYKLPNISNDDLLIIETELINYYKNLTTLRNIKKHYN